MNVFEIKDNGVTVAVHYCATDAVREYHRRCHACKDHSRVIEWVEVPSNGYIYSDCFDKAHIVAPNGGDVVFPLDSTDEAAYGGNTGYNSQAALEKAAYLSLHKRQCAQMWQRDWETSYSKAYSVAEAAEAARAFFVAYDFSGGAIVELSARYAEKIGL